MNCELWMVYSHLVFWISRECIHYIIFELEIKGQHCKSLCQF